MREHQFRAKDYCGVWRYGYYFAKPILEFHSIIIGESEYRVHRETLGEYIDKADMDAVAIFEGDLIDIPDSKKPGLPGLVRYNEQTAQYEIVRVGYRNLPLKGVNEWGKVVGNIYDNPELRRLKK